jgi:hypothetical protein
MMSTSKELSGKISEFEAAHSLEEVKKMARGRGVSTAGTKREIITNLLEEVEVQEGVYKVPQWPEIKGVFVGGCVERGAGSSFRAKAHAHNVKTDPYFGWICLRSIKRAGEVEGNVITKPSQLLWHEYAHILTPDHFHDDAWRKKMKELGQPIQKQYAKKARPRIVYSYFCPSCKHRWEGSFTFTCPKCGKSGVVSTRKEG